MKTAKFIKQIEPAAGDMRLYKLSEPVKVNDWEDEPETTEYVAVSAVIAAFTGPETYIFPANGEGKITEWGEMEGSYRGGLNHARALEGLGFVIA